MVQRLAVVLDQHVLVITADTHTHARAHRRWIDARMYTRIYRRREREREGEGGGERGKKNQQVNDTAAVEQDWPAKEENTAGPHTSSELLSGGVLIRPAI